MKSIRPIADIPDSTARGLIGIFFDIDDTFTIAGRIPAASFSALWDAHDGGLATVPITGRPAGWCDHIARMWPVTGVVGENGALSFHYDEAEKRLKRRFFLDPEEAKKRKALLFAAADEVLKSVPGAAFASDQSYRLFDVAIDFTEDVPPLSRGEVARICEIFSRHGLTTKVSSIHVNAWFGTYDKLSMTKIFAREVMGLDLDENRDRFVFFGDSPNDEPMFAYFPNAVGVANVARFLDLMKSPPAYVTEAEGGLGFAEGVRLILERRRGGT
jgi:HAD superfamily hydrolase (TIGR01484 family)